MRTKSRILCVGAVATVTASTMVLSLGATATAAPIKPGATVTDDGSGSSTTLSATDRAAMQRQAKLDKLADKLAGPGATESKHSGGYAGAIVDGAAGTLTVYWHGALPQLVADVTSEGAAEGLKVIVNHAAYSAHQLEIARAQLEKSVEGKQPATEPAAAWSSIAIQPDGSGLLMGYDPADTAAGMSSTEFATHASALAAVPVKAVTRKRSVATTRMNDHAPFYGGAHLITPDDHFCSSGFAGTYNGNTVMLTASHCGTSGTFYNGSGETYGTAIGSSTRYDVTFIKVSSTGNWYYDGAWNDPTGYSKQITSVALNHDGDSVCTSGAMSGIHCSLLVTNSGVDLNIGGIVRSNVVIAKRTIAGTMAVASGDSGGPVVTSADGSWGMRMQARGIISGGPDDSWVVCDPTWLAVPGNTCYATVDYIGMSAITGLGFTTRTS